MAHTYLNKTGNVTLSTRISENLLVFFFFQDQIHIIPGLDSICRP